MTPHDLVHIGSDNGNRQTSLINSLRPCDVWWQRSGSTLAQVMAWCLTAPSHYLNQCWLITSEVLLHSPEGSFTGNTEDISPWYGLENAQYEIQALRSQWVNIPCLPKAVMCGDGLVPAVARPSAGISFVAWIWRLISMTWGHRNVLVQAAQ